jgi:hypothetical protein
VLEDPAHCNARLGSAAKKKIAKLMIKKKNKIKK